MVFRSNPFLAIFCLGFLAFHSVSVNADCGGQECVDSATCINDECVCDSGDPDADPTLACYNGNEFGAQVTSDPVVMTYNKVFVGFPIVCRYLFTHLETELKDRAGEVVGACHIIMHIHHKKIKGKVVVGGYSLAISANYDNETSVEASFMVTGHASNGVYSYNVNGTFGEYLPDGPYDGQPINFSDKPNSGLEMKVEEDTVNKRMTFEVKKCGWRSYYRPWDSVLKRDDPRTPGIAIAANCAMHPIFKSPNTTIALPPVAHHGITISSIRPPGLDNKQTLINLALSTDTEQVQPSATEECSTAKDSLDNCDDTTRELAFDRCDWLFESPRYMKCVNPDTDNCSELMSLFNACVDVFCGGASCSAFQSSLAGNNPNRDCSTVNGYDELTNWVSGSYCQP